jgi:hypothetical protein
MPHRSAETATYAGEMARIELDLPDDVLDWVDDYASRAGVTSDEFLRRTIVEEVDRCHAKMRKELQDLRAQMGPLDLGEKTAAELIREGRDSR